MSPENSLENNIVPHDRVNAKELPCPLPLLRLKKTLATVQAGSIVQLDCSDSEPMEDVESWCDRLGHVFMGEKKDADGSSFYIKKKG